MSAKIVLVICALVAMVASLPAQPGAGVGAWGGGGGSWGGAGVGAWGGSAGANPWIPPWVSSAPWFPQWVPCTGVGNSCVDCTTKLVCMKFGSGLQHACTDPTLPYCNAGECSAAPTVGCGVPAVNANDAVAPRTIAAV